MIVYHKATGLRCVVIQINDDKKTVKVRTKEDLERNYYPQELKTAEEEKAICRKHETSYRVFFPDLNLFTLKKIRGNLPLTP